MNNAIFIQVVSLLFIIAGCNQSNQVSPGDRSENALKPKLGEDTAHKVDSNYDFYFRNSVEKVKGLKWKRILIDTVSDENSSWIEAQFSMAGGVFVKLIADDVSNPTVNSFETNSNIFLHKSPIKIGQKLDELIMKDSVEFSFDEGPLVIRKGKYEVTSFDLKEITDLTFDSILTARDAKDPKLLPNIVLKSKVDFLKIYRHQFR